MKQRDILKSPRYQFLFSSRRMVYKTLSLFDRLLGRFNPIVLLCYHAIAHDDWRYSTNPEDFIEQITELKRDGYQFISLPELEAHLKDGVEIPARAAVINFDDGYKDILSVREFIRRECLKPTVFVLSEVEHVSRAQINSMRDFLSWEDIHLLAQEGWTIGSHSATHASLTTLDTPGLRQEIIESRSLIAHKLGCQINYFAYPKGAYTPIVRDVVSEAGYTAAVSMDDGLISRQSDLLTLPRVGVDRTHTIQDFRTLYSPSVIWLRGVIRQLMGWDGLRTSIANRP